MCENSFVVVLIESVSVNLKVHSLKLLASKKNITLLFLASGEEGDQKSLNGNVLWVLSVMPRSRFLGDTGVPLPEFQGDIYKF